MQQGIALGEGQLVPDEFIRRDGQPIRIRRMIKQTSTGPCEAHDIACILQGLC